MDGGMDRQVATATIISPLASSLRSRHWPKAASATREGMNPECIIMRHYPWTVNKADCVD